MITLLGAGIGTAGVIGLGVFSVLSAALLFWKADKIADRLDIGPAVDVIEHTDRGMSDRGVQEFFTLHQEYLRIQDEKREEMQKDIRHGGSNGQPLNRQ